MGGQEFGDSLSVRKTDQIQDLKHVLAPSLGVGVVERDGDHVNLIFNGAIEMHEDQFVLLIRRRLQTSQIRNIQGRECVTCPLQGAYSLVEKDWFFRGAGGENP